MADHQSRTDGEQMDEDDLLHLLMASVKDYAIFIMDSQGIIKTWNPGAELMKGYRADEIIGQSFSCLHLPADIEAGKPHRLLQQAAQAGRATDEGWRVRRDGSRFWASIVLTALYNQ